MLFKRLICHGVNKSKRERLLCSVVCCRSLPWQCFFFRHSTIIYDNLIVVLTRKHISPWLFVCCLKAHVKMLKSIFYLRCKSFPFCVSLFCATFRRLNCHHDKTPPDFETKCNWDHCWGLDSVAEMLFLCQNRFSFVSRLKLSWRTVFLIIFRAWLKSLT